MAVAWMFPVQCIDVIAVDGVVVVAAVAGSVNIVAAVAVDEHDVDYAYVSSDAAACAGAVEIRAIF